MPPAPMPDGRLIEGVEAVAAGWVHEGSAADVVRALKYGRSTSVVTTIADRLALVVPDADLVTWVPCSPSHRRERGFDPAELLARAVARRLRLPVRRTLRRLDNLPQTSRHRSGRLEGPELRATGRPVAARVLLVDDVCTTGSTLRVAAAALRRRGAQSVVAAVATVARPVPAGLRGVGGG